jgi:intraflagellar transport protein 52
LREPPPPALDLFDLDDHFASERVRLAKLTNKCSDEHLDFYITQSAEILGVTEKLPEGRRGAKHCLEVGLQRVYVLYMHAWHDIKDG